MYYSTNSGRRLLLLCLHNINFLKSIVTNHVYAFIFFSTLRHAVRGKELHVLGQASSTHLITKRGEARNTTRVRMSLRASYFFLYLLFICLKLSYNLHKNYLNFVNNNIKTLLISTNSLIITVKRKYYALPCNRRIKKIEQDQWRTFTNILYNYYWR